MRTINDTLDIDGYIQSLIDAKRLDPDFLEQKIQLEREQSPLKAIVLDNLALKEENENLKSRVLSAESSSTINSETLSELIELLIEMGSL